MKMSIKSKSDAHYLFSKKTLAFISLLFVITLFSSPLILGANGYVPPPQVVVKSEAELRNAISTASEDKVYLIGIEKDISLKKPLEIPNGKIISLKVSGARLVGSDGMDAVIIKNGGILTVLGSLTITHAKSASGRGVYVERGGEFNFYGGEISGNSATKGGGVYNEGTFTMFWDGSAGDTEICGNTATEGGGGVYNVGTFEMVGGRIRGNSCVGQGGFVGVGGGVYNEGTFEMSGYGEFEERLGSVISGNTATKGGGVYNVGVFTQKGVSKIFDNTATVEGRDVYNLDVFKGHDDGDVDIFSDMTTNGEDKTVSIKDKDGSQFYLLTIIGLIVIAGVVGVFLFFYRVRRRNSLMVKSLGDSVGEVT
ncbi:MAG: hypothetical protein FWD52_03355 [Candidatus Bathyarchaeota archaeon]|nr:hypothetical protein [Candidatus Termiticorpusculum sp.]